MNENFSYKVIKQGSLAENVSAQKTLAEMIVRFGIEKGIIQSPNSRKGEAYEQKKTERSSSMFYL